MSNSIAPIKGAGQILSTFEATVTYVSSDDKAVGSDGYVRGGMREDAALEVSIVPLSEEDYDTSILGDNTNGAANIYVRKKDQSLDIDIDVGDVFYDKANGVEWKILRVSDYETVVRCICGRKAGGGMSVIK